jgi:hypothetical protein
MRHQFERVQIAGGSLKRQKSLNLRHFRKIFGRVTRIGTLSALHDSSDGVFVSLVGWMASGAAGMGQLPQKPNGFWKEDTHGQKRPFLLPQL